MINVHQWRTLAHLETPKTKEQIAAATGTVPFAMSKRLGLLRAHDLVQAHTGPDGKRLMWSRTEKGEREFAAYVPEKSSEYVCPYKAALAHVDGERDTKAICRIMNLPQTTVASRLKRLVIQGLASAVREGKDWRWEVTAEGRAHLLEKDTFWTAPVTTKPKDTRPHFAWLDLGKDFKAPERKGWEFRG